MKQFKFLILIFFSLITSFAWSQTIEVTPSYGYQFGTKLNYGPSYIQIGDSDQYGLSLGFQLPDNLMAEVTYFHQSTRLNIKDTYLYPRKARLSDLNTDWVFLGASKYFKNDKVRPFAGGGLGLAFFTPKNENFNVINRSLDNQTKFSFYFKGGVNVMLSDIVGINMQFNLLLPIEWGGVFVGGGSGGVSGGASASSSTLIAGFSGGLVFRLGAKQNQKEKKAKVQNSNVKIYKYR